LVSIPAAMVSVGLSSKPAATVSGGLASKPAAMVFAGLVRVSQSDLKTGEDATTGGACGIIVEVASESS
jgi:hypothetical protein